MAIGYSPFSDISLDPPVRGFLHLPTDSNGNTVVLTHGAGGNSQAALLVAIAECFADSGFAVLRCDLPFRQLRSYGPPGRGDAARDREGLRNAVSVMRRQSSGAIFLGGHSYGGRQATMLCAENPGLADGLILFSYPLHPPRKPEQLRTQHFPNLGTPCLFVHGTRDPFGSVEEMDLSLKLIPGRHQLTAVEGAGHDLGFKGRTASKETLPALVISQFQNFVGIA